MRLNLQTHTNKLSLSTSFLVNLSENDCREWLLFFLSIAALFYGQFNVMKLICVDLIHRLLQSTYETFSLPVRYCDDHKRFTDLLLSDGSWGITSIYITEPHHHFCILLHWIWKNILQCCSFYIDDWKYDTFIFYHSCIDEIVYRVPSSLWLSNHKNLWHRIKNK